MGKKRKATYFGFMPKSEHVIGGGEVKTKTVLKALEKSNKFERIIAVDTSNWKKNIMSLAFKLLIGMIKTKYIIIVQSTSAFLSILPILNIMSKFFKNEIHFIPVGNCLISNFDKISKIKQINKIKGVYVQSESIKTKLDTIGVRSVHVMHNFKYINSYLVPYQSELPLKFVYLSRISEEKGIFECLDVFKKINHNSKRGKCVLDIYGIIDEKIAVQFEEIVNNSDIFSYRGIIKPEESSTIIRKYFMLVFPTKYDGEGFPGTVIDAFAGGVPLLVSRFSNFKDMLNDHVDCISFEFNNYEDMYDKLLYCIDHTEEINAMRIHSHHKYSRYTPEREINILLNNMDV